MQTWRIEGEPFALSFYQPSQRSVNLIKSQMNMPVLTPSVYVPIGAVVAACIAASISFLTLVISKEQKISEFRQAWIDDLRSELAEFAVNARRIAAQPNFINWRSLTAVGPVEQIEAENEDAMRADPVAENRLRLAQSFYAVRLRLNPNDDDHTALIECLKKVINILNSSSNSLGSVSSR